MAFVPAPGVARVEMIYLQNQQRIQNVFHVKVDATGPLTEADLDAVRELFRAWHVNNLRGQQTSLLVLQQIEVRDMTTEDGLAKIYPCTVSCGGGAGASSNLPNSATIAVKWASGYAGRSRRGRTFHCGLSQAGVTGNQITTAYQGTLQTAYTALIGAVEGAGYELVVYSRISDGVQRQEALITPIASASVEINIDSQRRRLTGPGRGE